MNEHEIWLKDLFDNPRHQRDFAAINEINKLRDKIAKLESKPEVKTVTKPARKTATK